jgi:hypothetical protein
METMFIQAPQPPQAQPPQQIPSPPPTMVDTSASMETMAIPIPRPADPGEEPTRLTGADSDQNPGPWGQPPQR